MRRIAILLCSAIAVGESDRVDQSRQPYRCSVSPSQAFISFVPQTRGYTEICCPRQSKSCSYTSFPLHAKTQPSDQYDDMFYGELGLSQSSPSRAAPGTIAHSAQTTAKTARIAPKHIEGQKRNLELVSTSPRARVVQNVAVADVSDLVVNQPEDSVKDSGKTKRNRGHLNWSNPRDIAYKLLEQREAGEGGDFIENLLERVLSSSKVSSSDRGLCRELVYGCIRWRLTLDWIAHRKTSGRKPKGEVAVLLRLGLYQLFFCDRLPDHAIVHETVAVARRAGLPTAQSGFLNAALRAHAADVNVTRAALVDLQRTKPAAGYSHPEWLVTAWRKRYGGGAARRLMEWNNAPAAAYARCNTLRGTAEELLRRWDLEDVEYEEASPSWAPPGVRAWKIRPPAGGVGALRTFAEGWFYMQDPSTLLAIGILAPQPGEAILDVCAAPGGKTTLAAQVMGGAGRIVACDTDAGRLSMVEDNCRRLAVSIVTTRHTPTAAPSPSHTRSAAPAGSEVDGEAAAAAAAAAGLEAAAEELGVFDGVLVDAPCSNTGVMRRRVDLRWRLSPDRLPALAAAQLAILTAAAGRVAAGPAGRLVYSTCSLEPSENGGVVHSFLASPAGAGFTLESERQLLPFADGVDGAYVACLRRRPPAADTPAANTIGG